MADSCIECARNAVYYETTKLHELRCAGASACELVKQVNRVNQAHMAVAAIDLPPWQLQIIRGFAGMRPALPNMAGSSPPPLCDHQRTTYHRGWLVAAIASWAAAAIMMIGWALVVL